MRIVLLKILKFVAVATMEKFLSSRESGISKLVATEARIEAETVAKKEKLRQQHQILERGIEAKASKKVNKAAEKLAALETL